MIFNRHSRLGIFIVSVVLLLAPTLGGIGWVKLPLSVLTLGVLRLHFNRQESSSELTLSRGNLPYMTDGCERASEITGALSEATLRQGSFRRLAQYFSLSCEDDESVVRRFNRMTASGMPLLPGYAIRVSDLLALQGQSERAMALRRSIPNAASWYVNLGRVEIERYGDEPAGLDYFRLAQDIDPRFDLGKTPLYMHLCLIAIRENGSYPTGYEPCFDFDRTKRTALSRLLLARGSFNGGRYDLAIGYATDAIDLDGTMGDAYYWLAKSLVAMGNEAEGMDAYRRGIIQAPAYPWNYLEAAKLEASKKCYQSARLYLDKMSSLTDPNASAVAEEASRTLPQVSGRESGCQ